MKLKNWIFALVIVGFTCSLSVNAQTTFGAPDCGQWLRESNTTKKAWVAGFMSGLSIAETSDNDWLDKINSVDQIFVWMDNYCRKNPLQKVTMGGVILRSELLKKK